MSFLNPTLALSVIMKNEEAHIDRFFGSLDLSQFDQIAVVDTGSTDKTLEKLEVWKEKFKGFTFKQIEWPNDFAKARQESYDLCNTDYVMWADLDDVVVGSENIKDIMKKHPHVDSFALPYHYVINDTTGEVVCELERERIVRRSKFYWRGMLHEVLLSDVPFVQIPVDNIIFKHRPVRNEKIDIDRKVRNLDILKTWVEKEPDEPRVYFYLGNAYMGLHQNDEAEKNYLEYVKRSKWDDEIYIALTRLAKMYLDQSRFDDAGKVLTKAMHLCPDKPMAYFVFGEFYGRQGEYAKGYEFVELGFTKHKPRITLAENPADYSYIPSVIKFDLLSAMGRYKEAYEWGTRIENDIIDPRLKEEFSDKLLMVKEQADRNTLMKYIVKLREYLIKNDESLKAAALTKIVPYTLQYRDETKEMTVLDRANFKPQIESNLDALGCDLNKEVVLDFGHKNHKANWLMWWLEQHPKVKTILDVGCNWGWFCFWLESKGYEVVGVDINKDCLKKAEEKKVEYNSKVSFYNSLEELGDRKFDVVLAFDILEHIEHDKAFADTLMGYADHYLLAATPNGCFSRGYIHEAVDGTVQPHLRVYSSKTFKRLFHPWRVETMNRIQDDLLLIAAVKKEKINGPSMAIVCPPTPEPWGPDALERGVGGSEEAVIHVAKQFTKRGWDVTIFNVPSLNCVVEGIEWLAHYEIEPNDYFDVFIAWRDTSIFMYDNIVLAAKKYIWLHDVPTNGFFTKKSVEAVNGIFVLSEYHKSLLPDYAKEKAIVTSNGIDLEIIASTRKLNKPHAMVWTSSYVRGLEWLLEAWPDIRKEVPDAELHVMYGWETTDANPPAHPSVYGPWKEKINKLLTQEGITHYGRLPQKEALEKMGECGVFPYLTMFPEISCISCMKAQAVGAVPVTSNTGALNETNKAGIKLEPTVIDGIYTNYSGHVKEVIDLLKDEGKQDKLRKKGFSEALSFSWKKVVDQWEEIFNGNI